MRTVGSRSPSGDRRRALLDARRVNLLLEVLVVAVVASGFGSWLVPLGWARPFVVVHGVAALAMVVLTPFKLRGSVRVGMRRNPVTRWLSTGFGLMVLGAALFGFLHTAGIWHGVGEWSALWTHHMLGFGSFPFFVWHLWSRRPASPLARVRSSAPVPPSLVDLDRRTLLAGGAVAAVAGAGLLGVEWATRVTGSIEGRSGTGSREVGSFEPEAMPATIWLDDSIPVDADRATWTLLAAGAPVDLDGLAARAVPLTADLDCTGGWWSRQRWDVVPLASVLPPAGDGTGGEDGRPGGRSIRVTSATGYQRLFTPAAAAEEVFLAVGYDGRPLQARHGAPVRVVAPGRRGPWWVKWVSSVEWSDRPTWSQFPLPPT